MFRTSELVEYCLAMVGQPYWYGTCGYQCTESRLKSKAKQYPSHYEDERMPRYRDDIAKKKVCQDCIGLIKGFFWTGGGQPILDYLARKITDYKSTYKGNGMPDKSANGMFEWCQKQGAQYGPIATLPDVPGVLLFSNGHVGVYIGGGYAVEARGFSYGVVRTKVSGRSWKNWAFMPAALIEYDTMEGYMTPPEDKPEDKNDAPTQKEYKLGERYLRKGCEGEDVEDMQELLTAAGFGCGEIDGDFGPDTLKALKSFQQKYGLEVDGVYGPESHAKLTSLPTRSIFKIQVTGGTVNVRKAPDTKNGKIVRTVKKGAVLTAMGRDADTGWYILADGNYISNKYVKEI